MGVERVTERREDCDYSASKRDLRRALEHAEARFRLLSRRSVDVAVVVDADGLLTFTSPAVSRLLGWAEQDMVGHSAFDFIHPDDLEMSRRQFADALTRPGAQDPFDLRLMRMDGSFVWAEDRITNLLDDPDVAGIVVNFHDVTQRKADQEALRRSEARYRSIVETAQEGVWVTDPDGGTVFANQKLADILGRSLDEVYAMTATDAVAEADKPLVAERLKGRRRSGKDLYELPVVRPDGETRVILVSASPLYEDDGRYVGSLGMVTDITERKRAEEQLERRALFDELTGLPNRALLHDRLRQALAQRDITEPIAVLFLDLDGFKLVNDSYGHAAGDQLLQQVAGRLQSVVRASDTVGRLAGDEFVILCPGSSDTDAQTLADRVTHALALRFDLGAVGTHVSASIGIVEVTPGQDPDAVIAAADTAMLEAKRRGHGGHVTFDQQVAAHAQLRLQQIDDLRRGIDAAEFILHYQPLVQLYVGPDRGRMVATEALVRWNHPERGLLGPAEFIPTAERSGLIGPLGDAILQSACQQAAEWASLLAAPPRVAVNLSARQLGSDGMVRTVQSALRESGLAPGLLRLELTETTVMEDIGRTARIMRELQDIGVALSIDDFGTGYSSLAYLTRLPLDELKIDREFIAGVAAGGEGLEVVRAIVAMARALDLRVVAEGVETPEQADIVTRLGCDLGQGFLYARPQPADALTALMRATDAG
jgi:diguanylate cyclase (GGDEF)-like protein/PAS domain S-box-containing protein